jgi:membrane-associated protein
MLDARAMLTPRGCRDLRGRSRPARRSRGSRHYHVMMRGVELDLVARLLRDRVLEGQESSGPPGQDGQADAGPFSAVPSSAAVPPVGVRGWRPWLGRPRAADLVCVIGIALSGVYGLAMIPLMPVLIATRPVLLEMLSGSTPSIVAAGAFSDTGSKLQLAVVVVAALPGLMMFDVVFWWAGVLWGRRAVEWLGYRSSRAAALARRAEQRGARRVGPVVLVSAFLPGAPAPLVYAAAGLVGLRLLPFVVFDAIGSLAWAALLAGLGYELGPSGVAAANLVSRYALLATIAMLAIAVAPYAWQVLRARRERGRTRRRHPTMAAGTSAGTLGNRPSPVP